MGFLCFLLFGAGALLVCFSGKQKQRELVGFILIATAFFVYGFSRLHERGLIKATDYPTVTGQILNYMTAGRRDTRSVVRVRSDAGRRYGVYLDSTVPGIEPGDRVTFKYVEETGGAREFRVLTGRAAGTVVRDDDEDIFPYFWLFGGVVFSGSGVLSYVMRKRRQQRIAS